MGKTGRNEPCPCGSGKKYKKCCGDTPQVVYGPPAEIPPEILKKFSDHERREKERKEQFGEVKPEIAIDFKGYKMVAVGSTLHYSKDWKFFPDFLMDFPPAVLGKDWGTAELKKPREEQHQIVVWRRKCLEYMKSQKKNEAGFYDAIPSGFMAAYLGFAYDLYLVQHNGRLDEHLLRRLKHHAQFQGARHELFSEATCLRAGYSIEHEDEADPSRRHVEFTATHKELGQKVSVEAKSKHRPGVLGYPGTLQAEEELNLWFGSLLNDAINKNPPYPFVIFLDTNLPSSVAEKIFSPRSSEPFIPSEVVLRLLDAVKTRFGDRDPYNLIVFTNHPHHYGKEDEIDPERNTMSVMTQTPQTPADHPEAIAALHKAARLYGNIPNEFPKRE